MIQQHLVVLDNGQLSLTSDGLARLEHYRVKRAIIMGAGFGSRMMPATKDRPKPMVGTVPCQVDSLKK